MLSTKTPRDLVGSEIEIHRGFSDRSSSGVWLVWTERGPFLVLLNKLGWTIFPDNTFDRIDSKLFRRMRAWWLRQPALQSHFKTRREALAVLRAALAFHSSDGADR